MEIIKDVCYLKRENKDLLLDVYVPNKKNFSAFVFFHGGGITCDAKDAPKEMLSHLVNNGICVVSADYSIYPKAKCPEFLQDCAAAVAWAFKNLNKYGNVEKIFVGGSSAGAYFSQMLCFDKKYLAKHGILPTDVAGYIHDAGQPTVHFSVLKEMGLDPRRIIVDQFAPLYYVGVDKEYSPMLFIISDDDIECRYEQTMLLLATLKSFGHTYPKIKLKTMNGKHVKYVRQTDENGVSVYGAIIEEFINQNT